VPVVLSSSLKIRFESSLDSPLVADMVKRPILMGILNITPDSFSDGGKYFQIDSAMKHAQKLLRQKVDIIDVGGESTKLGAIYVTQEEELKRIIPVIKALNELKQSSEKDFLISVDTYKATVAKAVLEIGADIINDVSGLTMDLNMVSIVASANRQIIIMHNKGIPATKPDTVSPHSSSIISEVYPWLLQQTNYAINKGIKKENIIIDPGIGFGKTAEEDLYLIQNLKELKSLKFPILVGTSRKSFIKKIFPFDDLESKNKEIIELAIGNGADIVRIHSQD